jgi:hypothetical protein
MEVGAMIHWPDWLFYDVPNGVAGWAAMVTFIVVMTFGLTAIAAAIADRDRPGVRPFWQTFRFWLGILLSWCFAFLFGILALRMLQVPALVDVWLVALFGSWGIVSLIAFIVWAREETESRK